MIPIKLSLKNFLSYGEDLHTLDFSDFTIVCLSGKNGHGKSALLDAITWALWGRCRVKTKEEVIKRGSKEASVELEFDVDGDRYKIIRTTKRTQRSSSPLLDFQMFDAETLSYKSLAKTQSAIDEVLKIDYDSFICSSFILQGRADEFTKRTPAERKEVLANILELEKYDKLARKAREFVQRSKLKYESLETQINQLESEISQKAHLENTLKQIEDREERKSGELREIEKLYEGIIRESEALVVKIENYNKLVGDAVQIREGQSKLEAELGRLIGEIERDKEVTSKENEILSGYEELEKIREKERVYGEKLIRYTNLTREREKLNRLINDEKSKIEQNISSLKGRREELRKRLDGVTELLGREEEIKTGLEGFLNAQLLEKELEEKRRVSEELKSREKELQSRVREIKLQLEAKVRELEARVKEFSKKAVNSEGLREECEKLRTEIKAREETQGRCEVLRGELKEIGGEKKASISRKSELEKRQREETDKLRLIESQPGRPHCPLCESALGKEAIEALTEKLSRLLLELDNTSKEETKKVKQLEKEEKRIAAEIRAALSQTEDLSALNKRLGEREKSLEGALSARKDLGTAGDELSKIRDIIEKEDFGSELRVELKTVAEKRASLAYDEETHRETKNKVEFLRKFQSDNELLKSAKRGRDDIQVELAKIEADTLLLNKTLADGAFAVEYRGQVLKAEWEIKETGYDEKTHKGLRDALKDLEKFSKEKENLDRAKWSLSHKEKEREKLEEQLNAERGRLRKIDEEISGLEGAASRSDALREKRNLIENKVQELKEAKDEILREKIKVTNEIERIAKLEKRREEDLEQAEKLRHDLTVYQELDKAFGKNGIQALIIENAVPEIEVEANRILRRLTDGAMTLSLEMLKPTQKGGEKETLDIQIGDSSGTRSYETYSGGEAFRINFALRVAISKFIANRSGARLRTLVVDEGFGSQDKDGLGQFIHVIDTIKDDFDKIIVITHVDELKDRFPVRIEVFKEPGRGSSFEVMYS